MLRTPISQRAAVVAGAVLGAAALSMAACGPTALSPAGPSPTDEVSAAMERDALVALYNAAGGSNWTNTTNWLGSEPVGTWYGVETENGRVTKLDLCGPGGNNLRGTIPPELGNLTHARELRLSNNFLTGTIPSTLGDMTALVILRLSGNALSGPVPSALGSLSTLWELRLHRNQLTGELPRTLMNLPSLYRLRIEDNAGLCAPADGDFQEWLGALDEFESDCGAPAQARAGSLYRPMLVAGAEHGPLGFAAVRQTAYEAGRWPHAFKTSPTTGQSVNATGCAS